MASMYPDSGQPFASAADGVRRLAAFHAVPVPPELRTDFGDPAAPEEQATPHRSANSSPGRDASLGPAERAQLRLARWIEHHYGLRLHRSAALRRLLAAGAPVTSAGLDAARRALRGHRPSDARRRRGPGSPPLPCQPDLNAEQEAPASGREEAPASGEVAPPAKRARRDLSGDGRRAAACGANPVSLGRLSRAARALCEAASMPAPEAPTSLLGPAQTGHSVGGVPCDLPARDYEEAEGARAALMGWRVDASCWRLPRLTRFPVQYGSQQRQWRRRTPRRRS